MRTQAPPFEVPGDAEHPVDVPMPTVTFLPTLESVRTGTDPVVERAAKALLAAN